MLKAYIVAVNAINWWLVFCLSFYTSCKCITSGRDCPVWFLKRKTRTTETPCNAHYSSSSLPLIQSSTQRTNLELSRSASFAFFFATHDIGLDAHCDDGVPKFDLIILGWPQNVLRISKNPFFISFFLFVWNKRKINMYIKFDGEDYELCIFDYVNIEILISITARLWTNTSGMIPLL